MAKSCKCKKPGECEECPEWIFTFADLVMLMMGFFVILWVLKPSPSPKTASSADDDWVKTQAAIRTAFGYVPKVGSSDRVDQMIEMMNHPKVPDGPGMGGKTTVKPEGVHGTDPEVQAVRAGKQVIVGARVVFDRGDAALTPLAIRNLNEIADQIRGHLTVVLVKGHTALDDFDDKATPQQKMDLSLKRAQAVSDYLTAQGVDPEMLRVQGCSTYEPVVQRDYSPEGQIPNRRVEVESTPTPVTDLQSPAPIVPATQP
jgi:outer membrane protein OmpA-like peptidoglycan-associated protein